MGCTKVAPGCANCYAEADMDKRYKKVAWGPNGTRVRTTDAYWRKPLKWNREAAAAGVRHRVFCSSLADVFEDWDGPIVNSKGQRLLGDVDGGSYYPRDIANPDYGPSSQFIVTMDDLRTDLFKLIDATPNLDWLLLTKRPENIRSLFPGEYTENVWLGCSVSEQESWDRNIPLLMKCRDLAPVLFVSAEPLLGPINFGFDRVWCRHHGEYHDGPPTMNENSPCFRGEAMAGDMIDWIILGGEGHGERPCRMTWIRDGIRQCADSVVACHVKQLGSNPETGYGVNRKLRLNHAKGADWDEWPEDLRVRDYPQPRKVT